MRYDLGDELINGISTGPDRAT